ncbi:hypothetical protein L7F22_068702 [Adiantum nelumboides]|nr:hypothetical protein [Adiantum nelumboides]
MGDLFSRLSFTSFPAKEYKIVVVGLDMQAMGDLPLPQAQLVRGYGGSFLVPLVHLFPRKGVQIVIVGLDNASKTATLYKLHLGEVVVMQPPLAATLRPSWATYYRGTHLILLAVDITDRAGIASLKNELFLFCCSMMSFSRWCFKAKKPRCDNLEFKVPWKETQSLLQSPPNVIPSIVTIEGLEFEEYEDPPVFKNETILSDSLPQKSYTTQKEVPNSSTDPLQHTRGSVSIDSTAKKQTLIEPLKEHEAFSRLETLAFLATAKENVLVASSSFNTVPVITNIIVPTSLATTTKHPRHRPSCSCIVCLQPPSG